MSKFDAEQAQKYTQYLRYARSILTSGIFWFSGSTRNYSSNRMPQLQPGAPSDELAIGCPKTIELR